MYRELKKDLLKLLAKNSKKDTFMFKGCRVSREDCDSLLAYISLYEREGEISDAWKEKITHTSIAEVLTKYQLW